jgi:hypothetical protein
MIPTPTAPTSPFTVHEMTTVQLHETTVATPEQFLAALTDLGRAAACVRRQRYLRVHSRSADHAVGRAWPWPRPILPTGWIRP